MRNTINRYFSADVLACGFDDVHETLYMQHCEGLIPAREYQHRLKMLRTHFGVTTPAAEKTEWAPANGQLRLSRASLAILGAKIGSLQNAIGAREAEIRADAYGFDSKKMTIETGPVDIRITPYCDIDGNLQLADAEVTAHFDVTVKYTKRNGVRV